ncbi:MAG: hypothetical protein AB7L71_10265 [Vicinamibacterales bacterium]
MTDWTPEISGSSVVLRGAINPAIFQPAWFSRENLMSREEADSAKLGIISEQLAQFETESFVVQVTPDRFQVNSKPNTHFMLLKDLVIGTFHVLEHVPVTAMGINREMHFRVPDLDSWHRLGDKLAPKEAWNAVLGGRPGLATLEILAARDDSADTKVRVRVQPSVRVTPYGAYFNINEHYEASVEKGLRGLLDILDSRWEPAQAYAGRVATQVLDWAIAHKEDHV